MEQFVKMKSNESEEGQRMLFLDSCAHHNFGYNFGHEYWKNLVIDGYTAAQAQVAFWFGNSSDLHRELYFQDESYPCEDCCDPLHPVTESLFSQLVSRGFAKHRIYVVIVMVIGLVGVVCGCRWWKEAFGESTKPMMVEINTRTEMDKERRPLLSV